MSHCHSRCTIDELPGHRLGSSAKTVVHLLPLIPALRGVAARFETSHAYVQCWGKLLLKVMHYNIALLPKKVTNYIT